MPGFIAPCLATLADEVPSRGQWCHEIKFDGYRVQAHLAHDRWKLFTRRGYDWTARFAGISQALRAIGSKSAILDGEVIVQAPTGRSDFRLLQADLASGRADRLAYCAFDLLYLDGYDLRDAALKHRRKLLQELLGKQQPRLLFSDAIESNPDELLQLVCRMELEGIVSKQLDAPYRSKRQTTWLKIKCHNSDAFPIVAFVEKLGARPRRIASLYLGRYEQDRLLYAGKAQTGFTMQEMVDLREQLDPYISARSPLSVAVKKPKATWVEPELQAEIEFSTYTTDGLLRAPVYKGLRDDLAGTQTARAPKRAIARSSQKQRTVPRENILQLLPDAVAPDVAELTEYWTRVHKRALRYLAHRPLKLVRRVGGKIFYHKGPLPPIPEAVHQLKIRKREAGEGTRVWVDDLAGLIGLVEMDVVEVHPWNAQVDDIEHADVMVFDLDPGPGVAWSFVVDSAFTLRELLEQHGYEDSWPKLTGGKGMHVMTPLHSRMTHDAAHKQSRRLSELLISTDPARYTITASPTARKGRLFVDYLRNGRGTTAVGTFSPRAKPGFPIAAPVSWADVERGMRPDEFTTSKPPRGR